MLAKIPTVTRRFSTVADLEAVETSPGYAVIDARACDGFERHPLHCQWTQGLLSTCSALFGMAQATIEHPTCQVDGAAACRYLVRWPVGSEFDADPAEQIASLRGQLAAMTERLESVFATASDLISADDLDETLARITDRAAHQVRAPQYVLAVRPTPGADLLWHQKGFADDEAADVARQIVTGDPEGHPAHWLVAPVRSHRNHYGSLAAMFQPGEEFFPAERQLLNLYARYAAATLDNAAALREARSRQHEAHVRYQEGRALLELARRLATAGSSEQVALRLADAVGSVVDCDRVSVFLWDDERRVLTRCAVNDPERDGDGPVEIAAHDASPQIAELAERTNPEPIFIDVETSPLSAALKGVGSAATVAVPIVGEAQLLGLLCVSVASDVERLADTPELRDRLSGVAAHAVQALQNGRLIDHITHQATHDQLTGLLNRAGFSEHVAAATGQAAATGTPLAAFYVDLDDFKPVNDRFGHSVGDDLLRAVADRLAGRLRGRDTLARLGGDEFAVVLEVATDADLEQISARLAQAFEEPFSAGGHLLALQASIGRAVWPLDVETADRLLECADAAMYDVKHGRRGAPAALSG
jgi:diguanylate cyclase (GGDEF)-like protein